MQCHIVKPTYSTDNYYSHNIQSLVPSAGMRSHKAVYLKEDEHCCWVHLTAPTMEHFYVHTSVYMNIPLPLLLPGKWKQSRFIGYHIHDIGKGDLNLNLDLVIKHFERHDYQQQPVNY